MFWSLLWFALYLELKHRLQTGVVSEIAFCLWYSVIYIFYGCPLSNRKSTNVQIWKNQSAILWSVFFHLAFLHLMSYNVEMLGYSVFLPSPIDFNMTGIKVWHQGQHQNIGIMNLLLLELPSLVTPPPKRWWFKSSDKTLPSLARILSIKSLFPLAASLPTERHRITAQPTLNFFETESCLKISWPKKTASRSVLRSVSAAALDVSQRNTLVPPPLPFSIIDFLTDSRCEEQQERC